jgi:hypothetical protein
LSPWAKSAASFTTVQSIIEAVAPTSGVRLVARLSVTGVFSGRPMRRRTFMLGITCAETRGLAIELELAGVPAEREGVPTIMKKNKHNNMIAGA